MGPGFLIFPAMQSSATADSSPAAPIVSPQPPTYQMTFAELDLLKQAQLSDPVMAQAIHDGQWDCAASRWNSYITHILSVPSVNPDVTLHKWHLVTGEVVERGVGTLLKWKERDLERDILDLQLQSPATAWERVSAKKRKFSAYESAVLSDLHQRFTKADRTDWKKLTYQWLMKYAAEAPLQQQSKLEPRTLEVLKSQWNNRVSKKQCIISTAATQDLRPTTRSSSSLSSSSALSAATLTSSPSSDTSLPVTQLPSPQGSVASNNPPHPALSISIKRPVTSSKWNQDATKHFEILYNERAGKWKYVEFLLVWPKHLYGEVSSQQWSNKNLTLKRKAEKLKKAGEHA